MRHPTFSSFWPVLARHSWMAQAFFWHFGRSSRFCVGVEGWLPMGE